MSSTSPLSVSPSSSPSRRRRKRRVKSPVPDRTDTPSRLACSPYLVKLKAPVFVNRTGKSSRSKKKKDDDPMRMNASSTNQTLSTMQYYSIRIVLVTTTVIVAIFAKDFGSFISLIGWSCTGTLGLVLPGYMMIKFNNGNDLSRLSL